MDKPTEYPPTLTPLPVVEFVRRLQCAVVRSEDDNLPAADALRLLQSRVLFAAARFECEMGGVL